MTTQDAAKFAAGKGIEPLAFIVANLLLAADAAETDSVRNSPEDPKDPLQKVRKDPVKLRTFAQWLGGFVNRQFNNSDRAKFDELWRKVKGELEAEKSQCEEHTGRRRR